MRSLELTLDGQPFHALADGRREDPLLLFLHGFPEFSGAWAGVMAELADSFFCVAPDQRGYGRSWRPQEVAAYAMPELVADAAGMIEALGSPARAVIGHDWGAGVAYALAMRAPHLMDRLVVMNGVHPAPFQAALAAGGAQTEASQYIDWLRAEGAEQRLVADDYALMLRLFSEGMDLGWMTPALREAYAAAWGGVPGVRAMVNWYRASPLKLAKPGTPLPPEALPALDPARLRITVPHLLIWGMDDTALLPETHAGLEAFCDRLDRVEIDGADHWLHHQKPAEVAGHIRAFLQ